MPQEIAQDDAASERGSLDIADDPNPGLAFEVDSSSPQVDRAGISAALRVSEIWRPEAGRVIIERPTPEWTDEPVDAGAFLPVRAEEIRRWILEEDLRDRSAWLRRSRA